MPIQQLLKPSPAFGPDDIKILAAVFEDAIAALGLTNHNHPAITIVAKRIIAVAGEGERDPVRLRDAALDKSLTNSSPSAVLTKTDQAL